MHTHNMPLMLRAALSTGLAVLTMAGGGAWAQGTSSARLEALVAQGAQVARDESTRTARFVGGTPALRTLAPRPPGATSQADIARAHLAGFGADFGITDVASQTRLFRTTVSPHGTAVTRFEQLHEGVPVFGGSVVVNTDTQGQLLAVAAKVASQIKPDMQPRRSAESAQASAVQLAGKAHGLPASELRAGPARLTVYDPRLLQFEGRPARLAWQVTVSPVKMRPIEQEVLIDAVTGDLLLQFNKRAHARNRITSDAAFTSNDTGTVVCTEGQTNCTNGVIPDADKAHLFSADTHQFYLSRFGRDSYDGAGAALLSTVRFCETPGPGCTYDNAYWNGVRMVYGPGLVIDDVVGHELTHAVTERESGLLYIGESGAINESLSDIFGEFIDQTNGRGNDASTVRWLMGEEVPGGAFRSMSNPTTLLRGSRQPDRKGSAYWYTGSGDGFGVHINSGVGNKAAFLMTDGGTFNGRTIVALGLEKVARIYYEAQVALLAPLSGYADLHFSLYQACLNVVGQSGITSADCNQVRAATEAVEMTLGALTMQNTCPANTTRLELGSHSVFNQAAVGTLSLQSVVGNWFLETGLFRSAPNSIRAWHNVTNSDSTAAYRISTPIVSGDRIGFSHFLDTEAYYDGGVVEYSTNGGVSWVDAGNLPSQGQGYNLTLLAGSALGGRQAFSGFSPTMVTTVYDLSPLAGQTVWFRFRSATDGSQNGSGWYVDDVVHFRCSTGVFLGFASTTQTVDEGGPNGVVSVQRTGTTTGAVSVTWSTIGGTAVAGIDYGTPGSSAQRSGTLSWASGDTTAKSISVGSSAAALPIIDDGVIEANKSFQIVLSNPVGATLATSATTVTIVDNDSLVGFVSNALTVSEDGSNGVLTVQRTGALGAAATVTWRTVNGTAVAGQDFGAAGSATQRTGTLTWAAGDGSSRTIAVGPVATAGSHIPVINDTAIEGPETFAVQLSSTSPGVTIGSGEAVVTIVSDDRGIAMATAAQTVSEDAGTAQVMVTRAGSSTGAVSVNYNTANGTALAGQHFQAASGTLFWSDGDVAPKPINITIIDNPQVNAARTFSVTLSGATGATLSPTATSTTVTIADNDNTLQLSAATLAVTEGQPSATLTVTRLGGAGSAASVQWRTVNGTAVSGGDFGSPGTPAAVTGVLNWAAGDTTPKTISIPLLEDNVVEAPETFVVELFSPSGTGANLGALTSATVTITDNDSGVVFSAPNYVVAEGGTSVTVTVNRIGPPTLAASISWTTANGSAVAGQDFGTAGSALQRSGTLAWAAGTGGAKTIVIPILSDTLAEGTESFSVVLSNPSAGLVIGGSSTAQVTIVDDEVPAESTVSFGAPKYTVGEGAGQVTLVLNRVGNATLPVSVKFATAAGTATAGTDFVTQTGTVSWAAGDSSPKSIVVAIVNDAVAEVSETFNVTLSAPSPGLALGTQAAASVLILDDDELFPPAGQLPAGWVVPPGASAGWQVSFETGAAVGVASLRSQTIGDGGTAQIQVARSFVAGSVSFRVKVSSEAGFDALRFYVDGVKVGEWSGTTIATWQTVTLPLTAGSHTLRWSYEKDGSGSVGLDAAWLDAVVLPPAP